MHDPQVQIQHHYQNWTRHRVINCDVLLYHSWFLELAVIGRYHYQVKARPNNDRMRVVSSHAFT